MPILPGEFGPEIKLTKLDVACRQVRTAIRLWFTDGDPVSIHALAFAAHEIIHRLYKLRGLRDLLFDSDWIKDEYRSEWGRSLKKHGGFFKHADTDPDAEIIFNPAINLTFIATSVVALRRMNVPAAIEDRAFCLWLLAHCPEWFTKRGGEEQIPAETLEEIRKVSRRRFFEGFSKGDVSLININPLEAWFQKTGEKKVEFADINDIARNTLFDILGDKRKDYGIATLLKIERGTGGDVTAHMMFDWFAAFSKKIGP